MSLFDAEGNLLEQAEPIHSGSVTFPDDGHPDLTAAVLDLTGDARDEVVLWDQERVWIYTQDGPAPRGRLYAPARNPHYNDSNYRAHVSRPRWVDAPAR